MMCVYRFRGDRGMLFLEKCKWFREVGVWDLRYGMIKGRLDKKLGIIFFVLVFGV